MTIATSLGNPGLKIERAKHHINDLNARIADFLVKKPFELVSRFDPKTAERIVRIKINETIPDEFSLIIGDATHNLRSALDIAIFEIVGGKTDRPDNVQFPFGKNAQSFKSIFCQRQINVAGENVQRTVCQLKPYGDGNPLLDGLHRLDIHDKHKLIVPVGSAVKVRGDDMRKLDPGWSFVTGTGLIDFADVKDGILSKVIYTDVNRRQRRSAIKGEQKIEFQPLFSICFANDQPFGGALVIPKLVDVTQEVENAVTLIKRAAELDAASKGVKHG